MRFPPIKAGRALLWITLYPDETVSTRYAALRAVLKLCRLHPVDTTPTAEIVIVEEEAFRAHLDDVRAALGPEDRLHLVSTAGGRLVVDVIALADLVRRPVWLRG